jgi:5-methyltetrahydropteroyltriglutamate--homocysteine methyltransferase
MSVALEQTYRAETVGSFLRPHYLLAARQDFSAGRISAAALRDIEDRAIREIARFQGDLGFRIVTDGEFRRENWWIDFIAKLDGVEITAGSSAVAFDKSYVPKNVRTSGKLRVDGPITVSDYAFVAGATHGAAKVTIPSPTRMHFHGGRYAVSREAYPDIEEFFADIARIYQREIASLEAAGCRYVQIDDPLLTYFLSPKLRADVVAEGEDPDRRLARYLELVNQCIATRRPGTIIGIHLCRGNARSEWISEGTYEGIAEACFGTLAVDRFLLEFDDPRSGSFEPLRFMPKDKHVVLGLITTKTPALENNDAVKRRLEDATRFVALDRLAISPQCGFASVVEGNKITEADQRKKLELVVEIAREVWGKA